MWSSSEPGSSCSGRWRRFAAIVGLMIGSSAGLAAPAASQGGAAEAPNVVTLTMRTPHSGFNRMLVHVTICVPGTQSCATIDDVMVDTGSTGLRLEASAVPFWLRLPPVLGPDRKSLAECLRFVADDAWGPLDRADLHIGGVTAWGLPIQIIGDRAALQPASCPRSQVNPTSNGTLGIGTHLTDCQGECRQSVAEPIYFQCQEGYCDPLEGPVAEAYRLPNPVSFFDRHDNGVVFDLPDVAGQGMLDSRGTLTIGVGTEDDDRLGSAAIVKLDDRGRFTTLYGGRDYPDSYIDSGTETYIVPDDALPRCRGTSWAFCVVPDVTREAVVMGHDGARTVMPFRVGDYAQIRQRGFGASAEIAVAAMPRSGAFVWGAPFFLGKRVAVVLEGRPVPGPDHLVGPLYAVWGRTRDPR